MQATRLLLGLAIWLCAANGQVITTVAGTDWFFPTGSLPAVSAPLGGVTGVVIDASGNLYFADHDNHMVMRLSPDGILTVVAGNGRPGFSGDGGPATSASLNEPAGVALDAAGNLYIADAQNARIRKVTANGTTIGTVAGNGRPFTGAVFQLPFSVAVDAAGFLYVGDFARVFKVSPAGVVTTVTGNGTQGETGDGGPAANAQISGANALAFDARGNLYIGTNSRVRRIGTD